ncbi:hypothetical protein [Neosynechococcus sphagnicola]|nr:hypothetical protein [Neosynechococcus sphagnicola]
MNSVLPLLEFSHSHCIALCAVLVPFNLLTTLQTLIVVGLGRRAAIVRSAVAIATLGALTLILHVLTWWLVGVVMAPTFILLTLATVCLSLNLVALCYPWWLSTLLRQGWDVLWQRSPWGHTYGH